MLELSGTFMAMTFAVFVLYGLFAARVRDRIVTRPKVMRWLRRVFAGGFAALGSGWRSPSGSPGRTRGRRRPTPEHRKSGHEARRL